MNIKDLLNNDSETRTSGHMLDDSFFVKRSNRIEDRIIAQACEKFNNRNKVATTAPMDFDKFLAAGNSNHNEAESMDTDDVQVESVEEINENINYMSDNDYGYSRVRNPDRVYNAPVDRVTDYEHFVPTHVSNSRAQAVSLELFSMFFENNVSREVYDKGIKIVNKYMAELGSSKVDSLLSYYRVDTLLKEEYPVKSVAYDMCINGCFRFSTVEEGDFIDEDETCPHCGEDRYKVERASVKPAQTFQIVPLSEQLRFKLAHPEERAKMAYGTRCLAGRREDVREDIFDGDAVGRLLDCGVVGLDDILVSMFVDQFNPFKNAKMSSSVIHGINLNIDLKKRYKAGNMMQLAIIPGPNHPKDIASFLEPVLDDLRNLGANGLQFQTDSGLVIAKVHLVMATGDTPAVSDLMNLAHHNAHHGCRACISYGARDSSTTCIVERDGPSLLRTEESLHQSVGGMYGVKGPNVFKDLPTMTSTAFFGLDEMHLLGHGTGQQLYVALGGKFCPTINDGGRNAHGIHLQDRLKHHRYPFALDVSLEDIDKAICASRADIPADFTGTWRSLKESNGKRKAVDWIDFLLFVVPTIVVDHFVFDRTKAAVMKLVTACRISQQWRITAANIQETEEAIGRWHAFLRCEIEEKRLKPTVFVMNQHMLVHLGYMMREMSPLRACSCRPIERTIGVYSAAIKSRKKPGKNMENLLLRKAAINHCLGCRPVICATNDRRTSNFEVASNDVAGPQLWSRPTRSSLAELAAAIGIECQDLVRSLVPFWAREGIVSFEENDEGGGREVYQGDRWPRPRPKRRGHSAHYLAFAKIQPIVMFIVSILYNPADYVV
ncbi:hypothetical protein PHYBLDRAFT_70627 [Phycomyces blakesleeanus NRRL 1555(-)]|uniref:Uncharacterized protein n=1 Tax=Phycomyces blakesleeanus (strain ATCC 8743b / DSM 1359 / FGSC 10004 / NBRC 33097 / NRRL 1555) TaxID=763407 RepID=A0A162TWU1_PHYB8|nr:hypothetical protein PHYBLDRAFT_70627 [Phycomyces blakesleeanus NRRL 1555(-)]OAD70453.1 hypothetical protein PHYBLDRAFT_70627 [Phycomyces blakesleeanus NRRL 1555(-)]|eukprot:XP_018288493.1 hypothetical protein PHYBLDRAFT_70627 [Phycomyces blakesleeanus NRRL 1555(-)]